MKFVNTHVRSGLTSNRVFLGSDDSQTSDFCMKNIAIVERGKNYFGAFVFFGREFCIVSVNV